MKIKVFRESSREHRIPELTTLLSGRFDERGCTLLHVQFSSFS